MVGESAVMMWADVISRYLGKSFGEYNCMTLLYQVYTDMGISVPSSYNNLSLENYMDYFQKDPKKTTLHMVKLFRTLGQEVPTDQLYTGDLLAIIQSDKSIFPAMYTGNNCAITSNIPDGVYVFPLSFKSNRPILARRLT